MSGALTIVIPGKLENPLSGASGLRGHWSKHAKWAKTRKEKAEMCVLYVLKSHQPPWPPELPKRVTLTAMVGAEWDQDNMRAALKPVVDALVSMRLLNDDRPSAGHRFVYHQRVERGKAGRRGVTVHVEPLDG